MPKLGDIINRLPNQNELKSCFLPKNLIEARIVKGHGELTIGVERGIALTIASQMLSNDPNNLAGVVIFFNREDFNRVLEELMEETK